MHHRDSEGLPHRRRTEETADDEDEDDDEDDSRQELRVARRRAPVSYV
jgi:hypothetical protein